MADAARTTEVVRLCRRAEIEPGTARRFEVCGDPIALVRIGDQFFAVADTCSHEDYSLSEGEVYEQECEIECPKHGSIFDLRSGAALTLPATKPIVVYDVTVKGDEVCVSVPGHLGVEGTSR